MNELSFIDCSTPIDDAEVDRVERQFGFTFPAEFRAIYGKFNGGQPVPNRFSTADDTYTVNTFLPIKYSAGRGVITLERCIQWMKVEKDIIPGYLVPFAIDSFGGFLCFSVRQSEFGAIYLYRQDMYSERENAAIFLASSVSEFLAQLSA